MINQLTHNIQRNRQQQTTKQTTQTTKCKQKLNHFHTRARNVMEDDIKVNSQFFISAFIDDDVGPDVCGEVEGQLAHEQPQHQNTTHTRDCELKKKGSL